MDMNKGQIILYQTQDGESKIEVTLADDTVWLNLDQMAELFQRNKSTISRHIKNVFEEGEKPVDPDEPDNPVKPELIPLEINVPDYIGYTDLVFITANREVIWTSSNESILYVTEEGEVVILEMGVVTIRATDKNNPDAYVEKVVTITSGIAPTKLTIYQKDDIYEIKNAPNTQLLLQVKIEGPKEYDPRVTWKVSDETIATIDERGVLVPKKSGKVTVTVTSIIDNNVTGKVVITIK